MNVRLIVVPHGNMKAAPAAQQRDDKAKPQATQKAELDDAGKLAAEQIGMLIAAKYKSIGMIAFGPEDACKLTGGAMWRACGGVGPEKAFGVTIESMTTDKNNVSGLASSARELWLSVRGLAINLEIEGVVVCFCSPEMAAAFRWLSTRREIIAGDTPADGVLQPLDASLRPYSVYDLTQDDVRRVTQDAL